MDQDTEHAQLHQQELEEREQLERSQPWWWDQDKDQDWIRQWQHEHYGHLPPVYVTDNTGEGDERIQNHT